MKNNQFTGTANMRNTLLMVILLLASIPLYVHAADTEKGLVATRGRIQYTLHIGKNVISKNTILTGDSYVYNDNGLNIEITDPGEKFHIGIIKGNSTTLAKLITGTDAVAVSDSYALANYLVYDTAEKTVEAVPFDYGYVIVNSSDTGVYKISFIYTLTDKETGELITLKGDAQFEVQGIASSN